MKAAIFSSAAKLLGVFAVACLAGAISALVTVRLLGPTALPVAADQANDAPLTRAVEAFSCPKGLSRIVQFRGIEDNFAPAGDEPAHIDPRLLRNGFFADLAEGTTSSYRLRNFDEGGADKVLVEHFQLPRGIVSGKLVMRIGKGGGGTDNDGFRLGDLDMLAHPPRQGDLGNYEFGVQSFWRMPDMNVLSDGSAIISFDFADLHSHHPDPATKISFADYLGQIGRGPDIDLTVSDDTQVDALALLACQLPVETKGVTFAEERSKRLGEEISWLTCSIDQTQRGCDPFAGDRLCSAPGPVACYREGSRIAPAGMREAGISPGAFVGGEVRLSKPVAGDRFPHLGDANAFCQAQFGREWRVLSYHEGGGGQVISYSRIPPGSRALVNIRDQQYANCWDRDLKR